LVSLHVLPRRATDLPRRLTLSRSSLAAPRGTVRRGAACIGILFLVACGGTSDEGTGVGGPPTTPECPAADESTETLVGDVDGDGAAERIWVSANYAAAADCRFVVSARGANAAYQQPIQHAPLLRTPRQVALSEGVPEASALAAVDDVAGLEIVIKVEQAASVATYEVYTVREASLVRLKTTYGSRARLRDAVFLSNGSSKYFFGVDCLDGDPQAIASTRIGALDPNATRWSVDRQLLHAEAGALELVDRARTVVGSSITQLQDQYPELGREPFRSCPGRVGLR
jgi:hypothetical protein